MPQPARACLRDMKIEPSCSTVPVEGIRLQGRLSRIEVTGNLVVKLEDHQGATASGHARVPSSDEPEELPPPSTLRVFGRVCCLALGAAALAALSIGQANGSTSSWSEQRPAHGHAGAPPPPWWARSPPPPPPPLGRRTPPPPPWWLEMNSSSTAGVIGSASRAHRAL